MPQPYPDPNISTVGEIFEYANLVTNSLAVPSFLMIVAVALFILFKLKDLKTSDSLALSLFLTLILSAIAWADGWIVGKILGLFFSMAALAIIYAALDT